MDESRAVGNSPQADCHTSFASTVPEDLLYAECALTACGLSIAEEETKDCRRLLALLRRRMKMGTAIIVEKNANRLLFSKPETVFHAQSFVVCRDILTDPRMGEDTKARLRHGIRGYLGVGMILMDGRSGTLVITSTEPRVYDSADISLACDLSAMIEDRYRMRRETTISNTVANLAIVSVLLSSVQSYLTVANAVMRHADHIYEGILSGEGVGDGDGDHDNDGASAVESRAPSVASCSVPTSSRSLLSSFGLPNLSISIPELSHSSPRTSHFERSACFPDRSLVRLASLRDHVNPKVCDAWNHMEALVPQLMNINKHLQSSIERALVVAKNYISEDKTSYYISCFQTEGGSFVQSMNSLLQGMAKFLPDHSLMWSFAIDSSLAKCAHRTFYAHLVFFLEGLIFRWAQHCSSAQISIAFESHGLVDYVAPKPSNGATTSDAESAPGTPRSRNSTTSKGQGRLQHGYLRIFFQPLDMIEGTEMPIFIPSTPTRAMANILDLANIPHKHCLGVDLPPSRPSTPPTSLSSSLASAVSAVFSSPRSLLRKASSKTGSGLSTPLVSPTKVPVAEHTGLTTPFTSPTKASTTDNSRLATPFTSPVKVSLTGLTSPFASPTKVPVADNSSPAKTPDLDNAGLVADAPVPVDSSVNTTAYDESSSDDMGTHKNGAAVMESLELLRVLSDFLREIDPNSTVAIAPYDPHNSGSPATFMILIPCHFHLPALSTVQMSPHSQTRKSLAHPGGEPTMHFGGERVKPELDYRYYAKDPSSMDYGPRIRGPRRNNNMRAKLRKRSVGSVDDADQDDTPSKSVLGGLLGGFVSGIKSAIGAGGSVMPVDALQLRQSV